jgi:hypothetical protein
LKYNKLVKEGYIIVSEGKKAFNTNKEGRKEMYLLFANEDRAIELSFFTRL